jgi:hypothetical protein
MILSAPKNGEFDQHAEWDLNLADLAKIKGVHQPIFTSSFEKLGIFSSGFDLLK